MECERIKNTNYMIETTKKIGSGAFGEIYFAIDLSDNTQCAVKIENTSLQKRKLQFEAKVLKYLQGGIGIPKLHCYFPSDKYNFLVMDLLGINLEELYFRCKKNFSPLTIKYIALQTLSRIEFLHSKYLLHRDIKPENFTLSGDKSNPSLIYLIDFGLIKKYTDCKGNHIPYKEGKSFVGTSRYASINTHLGYEQSRRDDLESFVYMMIYFCRGSLPWQGVKAKSQKDKCAKIMDIKIGVTIEDLCVGVSSKFGEILQYVQGMQFEERPDYKKIKRIIKNIYDKDINVQELDWNQKTVDIFSYNETKNEKSL